MFKSFISWGGAKENLVTDVITDLKSINGELIPIGVIPLVEEFKNKWEKHSEILEILERWKKENKALEKAIDKVLRGGK